MNYDTFQKEIERVEQLSVQEQKDFYAKVLEEERTESSVRLKAYFQYAVLFYYEGNFRKAREILEPFAISYLSYAYIPEMVSCFNLMGVASQCEGEYVIARYFYTLALKIVEEHEASTYYAYEYNNISLTYIAQQDYETAYEYILLAEQHLPESDEKMGAYIYLNKSDIFNHLNRLEDAVEAYETSIRTYRGQEILPDDTIICGVSLYYKLKNHEKYTKYIHKVVDQLDGMYASEFIDACKVIFDCSLDDGNYELVERIIAKMDAYMLTHTDENKVGIKVEALKYAYAVKIDDHEAMLAALQKQNYYYAQIVSALERQRAVSMEEYLETHKHLQRAVQNETQANRAKTQFLANVSHDIRTPMNAIVGITNLMEHSLNDPDKLQNYLSKIQLSSRHMLGLINDLLDMNKIENGAIHLNPEPMQLREQIRQINDIIRVQTTEKGQQFEIAMQDIRHESLIADATRLRQVLLNIMSNSVKYTPRGGTIRLDIEEIACDTPQMAKFYFVVTDTGIGMEQELIDHIFDPFIRGEDSVVNKIQGTGLGMSIAKKIIDLMQGTIKIESKPGCGSKVFMTLEFEIDPNGVSEPVALADAEETEFALRGMRFLCAEDNELNAEILTAILEIEGASCDVYPDGEQIVEAFAQVQPGEYDAILMDIQMPNMNGYEAAQQIRGGANALGQSIPIIAMTANAFADDVDYSLAVGMDAHISKPIDMALLRKTIRKIQSRKAK